ncbi:unnamed protein product [Adineta steineri]|uniref:G-protein coupled receptors family 1 profile domain-containing protein n=1 Tax=Adineta steineri TaxID=433720 RepID=A0A814IQ15_9BILA|nr:unnamed protein product [Adineta steineri]CAF1119659.1 unnamed protein product [Adineta steineri]
MVSLTYIGNQFTIYGGYLILLTGILGNGINILIFLSKNTYRTTPCTFYFLIASIHNIIYITLSIITRTMSIGYGIDPTRTSVIWCKIRQFLIVTVSLIALTCSCLATIDQFLVTSRSVNYRRCSNIKWAHQIVLIVIIIWCLHGIPVVLFRNISPITNTCVNTNAIYGIYTSIYILGLLCAIPVLIMLIFGYLTYRNIRYTRMLAEQRIDRQFTKMVFIQVILLVICIVPYGINNTYNLITSNVLKDANRLENENFALAILSFISYFYYAVC